MSRHSLLASTSRALRPLTSKRGLAVPVDSPASTNRRVWERSEIQALYDTPVLELIFKSANVHRAHHDPSKVQL